MAHNPLDELTRTAKCLQCFNQALALDWFCSDFCLRKYRVEATSALRRRRQELLEPKLDSEEEISFFRLKKLIGEIQCQHLPK